MAKKKIEDSQRGVIYARYSSHAQKDASIEQQIEECRKYAADQNIQIIDVYADRAVSGRTDARPEFQRMLRDAASGSFRYVIAWKSNRIGRNMLQAMVNEERLSEMGVSCLYTEEDFDDTAAGRFALRSMMNVNQFYSENMAEDIRRGLHDAASRCKVVGSIPLGYRKGPDGGYEIDEPNADVVREIFTRVACGDAYADIARDLNARGIKTAYGREWNKGSFHRMMENERYLGVYIYQDIRVEGGIPQIIDKELFYKAQEASRMKIRPQGRHNPNGEYLLTGKLYCGECKGAMIGVSGTGKSGKLHHYYMCKNSRDKNGCGKRAVRKDYIEDLIAAALRDYLLDDKTIAWIADGAMDFQREAREETRIGQLEVQLTENKRAIKNIMAAIEQGIITPTTKDRLMELEREQTMINAHLRDEQASLLVYSRDEVISALTLYRSGDINDKKYQASLFSTLLWRVYLYDDNLRIVLNLSGNKAIDIGISPETVDHIEDVTECSYKVEVGPPKGSQTNTTPMLYRLGIAFVMVVPLVMVPKK